MEIKFSNYEENILNKLNIPKSRELCHTTSDLLELLPHSVTIDQCKYIFKVEEGNDYNFRVGYHNCEYGFWIFFGEGDNVPTALFKSYMSYISHNPEDYNLEF